MLNHSDLFMFFNNISSPTQRVWRLLHFVRCVDARFCSQPFPFQTRKFCKSNNLPSFCSPDLKHQLQKYQLQPKAPRSQIVIFECTTLATRTTEERLQIKLL